jgi:serine-type D-Ala-D-Ala carboxypeptidase (penicillin-binding protein 5/6)
LIKKVIILIILITILFSFQIVYANDNLKTSAKTHILMDYSTGMIISEENSRLALDTAGITRAMTILIVLEEIENGAINLNESITISKKASSMGGTQVFLRANQDYKTEDLIKAAIVASANDACMALAERIAGSNEGFVDLMNQRANELGFVNTVFTNATGINDINQKTCAYDMAVLAKELIKYELLFAYSDIYMDEFMHPDEDYTEMVNANKLIRFYDGADGVATGSSKEAGYCLIATAKKGSSRYIYVSLGSSNSNIRFDDAKCIMDYGFNNYKTKRIVKENQVVKKDVLLADAEVKSISLYASKEANILIKNGEEQKISTRIEIDEPLTAPIKKGQKCGELIVESNGELIEKIDIIAGIDVAKKTYKIALNKILKSWIFR